MCGHFMLDVAARRASRCCVSVVRDHIYYAHILVATMSDNLPFLFDLLCLLVVVSAVTMRSLLHSLPRIWFLTFPFPICYLCMLILRLRHDHLTTTHDHDL
ncbi:hypothetical protein BD311DRAFT_759642 [Dichomitus squalens]|uniref:Uncharacterized protein n=1 Tax=Dichomitus squalens TaxID=114155 RepID=A0A4Q9ML77_9APHY|nr:hypothetical protein BD311DRAFT_759642 [Dichomitus squalens]